MRSVCNAEGHMDQSASGSLLPQWELEFCLRSKLHFPRASALKAQVYFSFIASQSWGILLDAFLALLCGGETAGPG